MYTFIDQLLSNGTSRTIIHTIANLLQSSSIEDRKSFTSAKQFYRFLATTFDLQYGKILLATSSNAQREIILRKGLPFFLNHVDHVERCFQGSDCDAVQDIIQNIGLLCFLIDSLFFSDPGLIRVNLCQPFDSITNDLEIRLG